MKSRSANFRESSSSAATLEEAITRPAPGGAQPGDFPRADTTMTGRSLTRRASVLGFTAGALALSMTGSAYGCTFFYGKLTVSATKIINGQPVVSTAFADGSGGFAQKSGAHGYCPTGSAAGLAEVVYPPQDMFIVPELTVQVGTTTTCAPTQTAFTTPSGATGSVRWFNLNQTNTINQKLALTDLSANCHLANEGYTVHTLGPISIAANGNSAPTTFAQPPVSTVKVGDRVDICVTFTTNPRPGDGPPLVKLSMV